MAFLTAVAKIEKMLQINLTFSTTMQRKLNLFSQDVSWIAFCQLSVVICQLSFVSCPLTIDH
jgi:hypothetical protein